MNRPIAAGFGGAGGRLALASATDHAEQAGGRLVLLHVCVPGSPLDQNSSDPAQAKVERIDPPLARAFTITRARLGRRRTVPKIRSGKPEDCLTRVSIDVAMLVIGDGEGDRTVRRVVRQTRCPVVVVRPSTAAAEAPFAGHVVVGLDASMPNYAVLDFAFRDSAEHHLPLVAVISFLLPIDSSLHPTSAGRIRSEPKDRRRETFATGEGTRQAGLSTRYLILCSTQDDGH